MTEYIPSFYRRRSNVVVPGIIRLDRAVPFITQQIAYAIQLLEALKTKTLGDAEFKLNRIIAPLSSICEMSGDIFLQDRVASQIMQLMRLGSRSQRLDAIQKLRDLLIEIQSYEPLNKAINDEKFLDNQGGETGKKASPADLAKEGSLFVIMPFHLDFNDVWKGGIQTATKNAGFHPVRVDAINRSSNITDDIVESIRNCRIAVVDVTGNNPNVMFELGYVMALEKPYVIISQSVEFLPFDIRHLRTIVYTNNWSGIEELRGKLIDFLKEFSDRSKTGRPKKITGK